VAAEANFDPGERWEEVKDAIRRTHSSNPGVHYILLTKKLSMLELASSTMATIPHDLWYCPEVLYGTPIHIGNLYAGDDPELGSALFYAVGLVWLPGPFL
jgi:hypothetical protein